MSFSQIYLSLSQFYFFLYVGDNSNGLRGHHLHSLTTVPCHAPAPTHPRCQLRICVICITDSDEPKNKSEFHFFKRRLTWVAVFCTGYKVQFSLLLSQKIVLVVIKYFNQKRYLTDSKKKKIGQGVASANSDQDLHSLLDRVCRA